MRTAYFLAACWLSIFTSGAAFAQVAYEQRRTAGPDRGWLIIQGGGRITNETRDRFLALAGGPSASIVAIPTARADREYDASRYGEDIAREFGVSQVTVLHTRDRKVADAPATVEPLKHATGVFLDGGRQWRLADAYLGTAVEREIKALLERGGVVLGGSAGATIQGSLLLRGDSPSASFPDGDNRIMVSPHHLTGFGLLANAAIDQHVDARSREADLDPVIGTHPHVLGIGLYEESAIIVHGNSFFVVSAPVLIHDGQRHGSVRYYKLSPGDVYDLARRAVVPAITAAQAKEYPLQLNLNSAARRGAPGGTRTVGTGVLETPGASEPAPRAVGVDCEAPLYSQGAARHPARLDAANAMSILYRDLAGDALRSSHCRIADPGSGPAASGLPNMSCGAVYSPEWDDCVGRVEYPDGNVYRGEFHDGLRDGFGVLAINARGDSDQDHIRSNEPALYAGEFRGGQLNGRGVLITRSGLAYGNYRANISQSDGSQSNCVGPRSASWSACVATLTYRNGNVYHGQFVKGARDGIGILEINATGMPDASRVETPVPGVYVGEYQGDRLNGRGMIFMPGGGFYGTFTNNVPDAR